MKRKFLEDLGIEKEAIDKIMAENGRDIEAVKGDIENLKTELKTANKTIAERDTQLEEIKEKYKDSDGLAAEIEKLRNDNKAAAENHAAEIRELKINSAVDKALAGAKAKTPKAVRAMLDMNAVKIDKDGNITGIDEQIKAIAEAEDTSYLFDNQAPTFKGTQPGYGAADDKPKNVNEMNYTELCAYMESHPDAQI